MLVFDAAYSLLSGQEIFGLYALKLSFASYPLNMLLTAGIRTQVARSSLISSHESSCIILWFGAWTKLTVSISSSFNYTKSTAFARERFPEVTVIAESRLNLRKNRPKLPSQ
jgi:hypothetical protein